MAWLHPGLDGQISAFEHPLTVLRNPFLQKPLFLRYLFSPEIIAVVLAATDFLLVCAAAAVTFVVYADSMGHPTPDRYVLSTVIAATVFVVWLERVGGYRLRRLANLGRQLTHVLMIWGGTFSILILIAFVTKISETYSRVWVLGSAFAVVGFLSAWRGIFQIALNRWLREGSLSRRIAILGAGAEGCRLITKLRQCNEPGIAVCGVFDDRKSRVPPSIDGVALLGTTDDLIRLAQRNMIDEVIVALPLDAESRIRGLLHKLQGVACDLRLSAEPIAQRFQIRGVSYLGEAPVLVIADRPLKTWGFLVKWIEDKILASFLLILLAPILALIALAIKLDSRGPVLFVQQRFGFNNEVFYVFKYRTMHVDRCDQSGASRTVRLDPRVTRVGRMLRHFSLDELPQLFNVLRGDMSLVGPRPHAVAMRAGERLYGEAVEQYSHRHRVKPGITGWAQINGFRGEVDSLEKAEARVVRDLYYIEHWSPWLDMKILIKTIGIVVWPSNAY